MRWVQLRKTSQHPLAHGVEMSGLRGRPSFFGPYGEIRKLSDVWRLDSFRNQRNRGFQEMKSKFLALICAGFMLIGGAAQAAVLSLDTSGPGVTLNVPFSGFNPSGVLPALPATMTAVFDTGVSNTGLSLSGAAPLKFEYIGKEAVSASQFTFNGEQLFTTASPTNTSLVRPGAGGTLPFIFSTLGLNAANGGPIDQGIAMAYAALSDGSYLLMFNNAGGDRDFDDMVVHVSVSAVPLPAAAWLLISAILGLVSFSRIRRNGAQTA